MNAVLFGILVFCPALLLAGWGLSHLRGRRLSRRLREVAGPEE